VIGKINYLKRALGHTDKRFLILAIGMQLRAQGATEYLVLLAVVLIVALVSVALLGFFPGMASDAQMTQSKAYWSSASPIAITEWDARARATDGTSFPYLRIKNNGAYPIRVNGIVGGDGAAATTFYAQTIAGCEPGTTGYYNISDYFYMAPGEEKYFAWASCHGSACSRRITSGTGASSLYALGGATTVCQNSSASPGSITYPTFGFEYTQYMEGQQIAKRQIGAKPLIIKCRDPY